MCPSSWSPFADACCQLGNTRTIRCGSARPNRGESWGGWCVEGAGSGGGPESTTRVRGGTGKELIGCGGRALSRARAGKADGARGQQGGDGRARAQRAGTRGRGEKRVASECACRLAGCAPTAGRRRPAPPAPASEADAALATPRARAAAAALLSAAPWGCASCAGSVPLAAPFRPRPPPLWWPQAARAWRPRVHSAGGSCSCSRCCPRPRSQGLGRALRGALASLRRGARARPTASPASRPPWHCCCSCRWSGRRKAGLALPSCTAPQPLAAAAS
jgi:hypothetical protein